MLAVDARVDDRDAHRRQRGRVRPAVERMDRAEVPLVRAQRIVGRVRSGRRREKERSRTRRGERAAHQRSSCGETPGTYPWPVTARTRYVPGLGVANEKEPSAAAAPEAT